MRTKVPGEALAVTGAARFVGDSAACAQTCGNLCVLVADGHRDSADTLALALKAMGHDAHAIYDGRGAPAAYEIHQPDVGLLDCADAAGGLELARRLRAQAGPRPLVILAIAAHPDEALRERLLAEGFDHVLSKPLDVPVLAAALRLVARAVAATRSASADPRQAQELFNLSLEWLRQRV